jgi:hypothetical protein
MISGWITAAGGIKLGTGFTATRMTLGTYKVVLTNITGGTPIIPVVSTHGADVIVRVSNVKTDSVTGFVEVDFSSDMLRTANTRFDSEFAFHIILVQ